MIHADASEGHNYPCPACGAWVSPYGCPNLPDQFDKELARIRRDFPDMAEHDARAWAQERADDTRGQWASVAG
jgi:hypothetical protein